MSRGGGYLTVAFKSVVGAASLVSGVPSSKQKFRERSAYVRLQVGQRFIYSSDRGLAVRAGVILHFPFVVFHLSFLRSVSVTWVFRNEKWKLTNDKRKMNRLKES